MNSAVLGKKKVLLKEADMKPHVWAEAILQGAHFYNCTAASWLGLRAPHEAMYGTKPDAWKIRVFGCAAFSYLHKQNRAHK